MGLLKTKGIIIAEHNSGDFDKMLTMLTPGYRQNILCSKRCKKTEKPALSGKPSFMFWRIYTIQRRKCI